MPTRPVLINFYVNIHSWCIAVYTYELSLKDAICICSYLLRIKSEVYWSIIGGPGRSYIFNLQLLGLNSAPTLFIKQITIIVWQAGCWPDVITFETIWNNLKQIWKHWTSAELLIYNMFGWKDLFKFLITLISFYCIINISCN